MPKLSRLFLLLAALCCASVQPAQAATPNVLSTSDITTYKKLFAYQRALKTEDVSALKPSVKNPLLLGHLDAELLLHPNTKSSYENLTAWLKNYADHPQERIITSLAKKRSPDALMTALIKESTRSLSAAKYSDPDVKKLPKGKTKPIIKDPKTKKEILTNIKRYIKKRDYLAAYKLLQQRYTRKLLGDTLWAQHATSLGRYLLNQGHFKQAENLGLIAAAHKSKHQLAALWQSGFASYRLNNRGKAQSTLRQLVNIADPSTSHYARAAFWLGRINQEGGNTKTALYYYELAAKNQIDFYGQLALANLPEKPRTTLWHPKANPQDVKIFMSQPAAKRVVALSQIGEYALAQKELKKLRKNLPYKMDETLLAIALERNLPNAAFTFGYNLKQRGKLSVPGLYPIPAEWSKGDLHGTDPALMYAVMRQESAFDPTIVSRAGARGLMQIMPATSRYILGKMEKPEISTHRLNRPHVSMDLGGWYINYLKGSLNDNLLHVLAAYNGGIGNVRKWQKRPYLKDVDALTFIESIPFNETRKYTKKVFANYWIYQQQLGAATPTRTALGQGHQPILIAAR